MVPSDCAVSAPSAARERAPVSGRRNTTVPCGASSASAGGIVAVPSVVVVGPESPAPSAGSAASDIRGSRGSGPCGAEGAGAGEVDAPEEPQEIRRSLSPPKPVWRERSAPHAEAGSGRLPCRESVEFWRLASSAGSGSSSKKCGPVSSTAADAPGPEPGPDGGVSGSPSLGAGRLVPGTQEAPFQYRTYPGMDGSG
ncbi:hypothetical protein Sipo7851_24675 [Streptomyces ipomoeae]|nr:hypothetical protein [Streptomyces ipomoeae]TQE32032.1 hypothetical protein Sipo7851_24675 [Streptomyces ipomoeae]